MLPEGAVGAAISHFSERETYCRIAAIVMGGMLTHLHYQMAIRSFQMITQVPDRVSRWFGQGGEQLGEDSDTKQSTTMVVGEVRSGVQGITGKGGTVGATAQAVSGAKADNASDGSQGEAKSEGSGKLTSQAKSDNTGVGGKA
tara:strand:+ start:1164 stop:1592 length:429 start_codon:yes stop_codon:yes gene_type:complete